MEREIGNAIYKEALRKQIEKQVQEFLGKGGKIKREPVKGVAESKAEVLKRLEKGQHFVTPDYRENCE